MTHQKRVYGISGVVYFYFREVYASLGSGIWHIVVVYSSFREVNGSLGSGIWHIGSGI